MEACGGHTRNLNGVCYIANFVKLRFERVYEKCLKKETMEHALSVLVKGSLLDLKLTLSACLVVVHY